MRQFDVLRFDRLEQRPGQNRELAVLGVLARVAEVIVKLRVAARIEVVIEEVGKVVERCIEVMADCAAGSARTRKYRSRVSRKTA